MVVPAMQLASKIPGMSVQLWSSALLRGERRSGRSTQSGSDSLGPTGIVLGICLGSEPWHLASVSFPRMGTAAVTCPAE